MASMERFLGEQEQDSFLYGRPHAPRQRLALLSLAGLDTASDRTPSEIQYPSPVPSDGSTCDSTTSPDTVFSRDSSSSKTSCNTSISEESDGLTQHMLAIPIAPPFTLPTQHVQLSCPFEVAGCKLHFTNPEHWYNHSVSHFGEHGPPTCALCIFCDQEFMSEDPQKCWKDRMDHTRRHLVNESRNTEKPDFFLLRYMYERGLLAKEDWENVQQYGSRSRIDGILKPGEVLKPEKPQRGFEVPYGSRQENRQREKERARKRLLRQKK